MEFKLITIWKIFIWWILSIKKHFKVKLSVKKGLWLAPVKNYCLLYTLEVESPSHRIVIFVPLKVIVPVEEVPTSDPDVLKTVILLPERV